ncbi:conserved hypothetical protein [Candidatus Sulfobium mesophilum]|uniref:NodB homology domain-containing protein n=1 Tax=Candidatus Sulfobium mesophilum TaxID=2016548 RepID=A0A2U3QDX4_9BACT|nr:conserved hypothetical protein [Candidatus Sulfobium mesophilum]
MKRALNLNEGVYAEMALSREPKSGMNKSEIKRVTRILKPLSSLSSTIYPKRTGQRIILSYHGIAKRPDFNCTVIDLFRDQIAWLKENCAVVPLHSLVSSLADGDKGNKNLASITFDDGYLNFAELALPVLEKHNVHATVFIPSGKINGYNDWDEGRGEFHKMTIMSYDQLRALPSSLVEIGSHGLSHRSLDRIATGELVEEVVQSRVELEQGLGRPVRFFAFPYGGYPPVLYSEGKRKRLLGAYTAACTSRWGRFNSTKDIYALRRIGIWHGDSFTDFTDKLSGRYDWLVAKETIGKFVKRIRSERNGASKE